MKNIALLAYTNYESDGRVRRYAESLARRGDHVDVIALADNTYPLGEVQFEGVSLFRLQLRTGPEPTKWVYGAQILRFLFAASRLLRQRHRHLRYDLIHAHNVPDFLVFACWYPKFRGTKIILDIHDILPELFANKFQAKTNSPIVALLRWIEKMSANFADHVIISNDLWLKTYTSRSAPPQKCTVYVNNVDQSIFYKHKRTRCDDRKIILFPGTFQWHQGLDLAIEAMPQVLASVPNAELHLYGNGPVKDDLEALVSRLQLQRCVKFFGGVRLEQMAEVIANADLGIVPKRADSFGNEAYSTKIMEFMSQGVPAVISRTAVDTFYFDDTVVRFFNPGDSRSMADGIVEVLQNPSLYANLSAAGLQYADRNGWSKREVEYLKLVDSLT